MYSSSCGYLFAVDLKKPLTEHILLFYTMFCSGCAVLSIMWSTEPPFFNSLFHFLVPLALMLLPQQMAAKDIVHSTTDNQKICNFLLQTLKNSRETQYRPVACTGFLKGRCGKKKKGTYKGRVLTTVEGTLARALAPERAFEGTLVHILAPERAL